MFRLRDSERGSISVIVAISMVVVLGMAALVIDIGATQARRAQLQEAVDASALALAQGCAESSATTVAACASSVVSGSTATVTALAQENLNDGQVAVGTPQFTSDTVRVTATSNQVGLFSRLFGIDSSGLLATAVAEWKQPPIPLPLAFHECVLPAASNSVRFLRYDPLYLGGLSTCPLLQGVLDVAIPNWFPSSGCGFDVGLLEFVVGTGGNVLPSLLLPNECASLAPTLIGKEVLLPVYNRVLGNVVIDGVLLNRYEVEEYALFEVTGYDFQSLGVSALGIINLTVGPKNMPGAPQCPTTTILFITLEEPLCQGIQGRLTEYLTPEEAAQRLVGVQLIE